MTESARTTVGALFLVIWTIGSLLIVNDNILSKSNDPIVRYFYSGKKNIFLFTTDPDCKESQRSKKNHTHELQLITRH